jgi:hypothetical protein
MHKGSENNLIDNLYLCIKKNEHNDPTRVRKQIAEKLDLKKEVVSPKELLLPESFSRRHSSPFSIRRTLSVIKNYWKK